MLFELLLPLASIPAVFILLIGFWSLAHRKDRERRDRWILFLLLAGGVMTLPLAIYAHRLMTGRIVYVLLLEIPALIGVFTLLLLNLRNVYTSWQKEPGQITALLLVLVLLLGIMGWREPILLLIVPLPPLFLTVIWIFGRRLGVEGLTALSVFLGVVLILETVGLVTNPYFFGIEWLRTAYRIVGFIFIILVSIITPLLIHRSAQAGSAGDRRLSSVYAILVLFLILGLAGTMYRDGLMVEATGHAAEDHMPLAEVELGVIGGILLTFGLRKNHRVLGMAYTVLAPAIIALAYIAGGMINTEAVTASRAERIAGAIAHYYEDNKVIPAALGELTPGYLPIILGPLTGRGRAWCYQAGTDYYRLGYAYHQRYYRPTIPDPFSEIRIHSSFGQAPPGLWMCDDELEQIKATGGL